MQIESVETNAGIAICSAPSMMACRISFPSADVAVDVLDLDGRVVHQDADREREPAQRHHVERLPERREADDRERIASGIEVATMSVLRQLPRKRRIISAVRHAAISAFAEHARDRGADEDRLVRQVAECRAPAAASGLIWRQHRLHLVDDREASTPGPFLSSVRYVPRLPFSRTMFVCTPAPSRTCATSPHVDRRAVDLLDRQVVELVDESGLEFRRT